RPPTTALSNFVAIGDPLQQGHRLIQGEGGGILGSIYDPLRVRYDMESGVILGETRRPEGVDDNRMDRRRDLLGALDGRYRALAASRETQALDRYYQQAFSLMTSGEATRALDLKREPESLRDRYGRTKFGQSCLLARRLVESGVPFVQVNWS